mmetsp:Transcript_25767/g.64364  ORF Transcript_25767/g.64364 Transcript_25767/m.64364 type:complete len:208 (-) Transcript_25767:938-1561(-)
MREFLFESKGARASHALTVTLIWEENTTSITKLNIVVRNIFLIESPSSPYAPSVPSIFLVEKLTCFRSGQCSNTFRMRHQRSLSNILQNFQFIERLSLAVFVDFTQIASGRGTTFQGLSNEMCFRASLDFCAKDVLIPRHRVQLSTSTTLLSKSNFLLLKTCQWYSSGHSSSAECSMCSPREQGLTRTKNHGDRSKSAEENLGSFTS